MTVITHGRYPRGKHGSTGQHALHSKPSGTAVDEIIQKEISSRGYRISYLVWGADYPLVLVPGQLQAAEDWATAGYLARASRFSSHRARTSGIRLSEKPNDPTAYHFEDRAADIAAVVDAAGFGLATLWGYSFGAMQVEAFARLRPDRTNGVVLGGTVPGLSAGDRRNIGEPGIYRVRER